ncbi:MAG: hypothetical protein AAF716_18820 [Cyanobacteria bacterium P01_D01_bin.1]
MKHSISVLTASMLIAGCSAISELSSELSSTETSNDSSTVPTSETNNASNAQQTEAKNASAEDEEGVNQENVRLIVQDQATAGQIIVKEVATARDGWVSIHKSNEDGGITLPNSIGEARVDSGKSQNVVVDLWEAPYVEEKLWVLLHVDSGERGIYEFPGKDVAVKKDGETMARSFRIKDDSETEDE